jgi:predicted nucleic acid-binding protein
MPDRLIDTNILVYAYDTSEGAKHDFSKNIVKQIWKDSGGVVCVQNLMEFFVVITKKVTPQTLKKFQIFMLCSHFRKMHSFT